MARMPRLLRREPAIDEAELELARARSLERLRQIGAPRQADEPQDAPPSDEAAAVATADAADAAGEPADAPVAPAARTLRARRST